MERWQEYWQKYQELGSYGAVATHFEVQPSSVRRAILAAAKRGEINLTAYQNPPGFATSKVTVHADAAGNVLQEWRRISPQAEDIEEWVQSLCDRAGKAGPRIKAPKVKGDTALEIPVGDMHVGMRSWAPETGVSWDTDRACNIFRSGVGYLMDAAPKGTKHLFLADLGDFLHADNRHGTTEKSGNVLDMAGSFCEIIDKGRDAWIDVIESAAVRFPSVHVVMIPGNHNFHGAHWMARIIAAHFRKTRHVTIDTQPKTHRYHRWERTLWGIAHGHQMKANILGSKMATDCRREWGETYHHHWRNGHIHHAVKDIYRGADESDGVTVEYFPILPPRDAYHAEKGYESRRLIQGILHHAEHGEITRHTYHAKMAERG